jgi:protein-tyrosine-phosphatase
MIPTNYNVLYLCTGNSARSILAEAILERMGSGQFRAYSAGSFPRGEIHPAALNLLRDLDHPTDHLRSKSWDEFTGTTTPQIDFIFTVCDNTAAETCPIWSGQPMTVHWGLPDPAAVEGSDDDIAQAFSLTYHLLSKQISAFTQLVIDSSDKAELLSQLVAIGSSIAPSTQEAV